MASTPAVRAIDVKLSQGAKPGLGGILPAAKVTPEIAALQGVPAGVDCVSLAAHSAFRDADSLLDFVEELANAAGLPVGIKSAVGDDAMFRDLARLMADGALVAFALGCGGVNVGREAMFSIGCIQAQRCHTGRCPTGVTTHSHWLTRGLDPELKSVRCANYLVRLREELLQLSRACGKAHPSLATIDDLEIVGDHFDSRAAREVFGYEPGWGAVSTA